jgi:hypothetical protein
MGSGDGGLEVLQKELGSGQANESTSGEDDAAHHERRIVGAGDGMKP